MPRFSLLVLAATAFVLLSAPSHPQIAFSFRAIDATASIDLAGERPLPGETTICAVAALTGSSALIDTNGAACATVDTDGGWELSVDPDAFPNGAFLVLEGGALSSTPQPLVNGAREFDRLSPLELNPVAIDGDAALRLSLEPRETEVNGTVTLDAFVFDALAGALESQQVTFSFDGPGSPSNDIPVLTDAGGRASITVFAGALGTVQATARLTPTATLTVSYSVIEPPEEDPLPALRGGFNAWLGRDANASEVVGTGQILWKWIGNGWASYARTNAGLILGADYELQLGDVLFLGMQS